MTEMEELTRETVLDAIAEFDDRGSDEFFRHFGIRIRAKSYFIRHKGREYDMKAVVRVARGQTLGKQAIRGPLERPDMVARWLKALDFEVVHHKMTSALAGLEGRRYWAKQKRAERDSRLAREAKKLNAEQNGGWIKCEACGFQDKEPSIFDAHHKQPLAATGVRETRVDELAVLCPTCHRWSHKKAGNRLHPLPVEEVRRGRRQAGRSNRR